MKKNKLADTVRLQHILEAIEGIEACKKQVNTYELYIKDIVVSSAVERLLILIGEASRHLSDELKFKYQNIDWGAIIGLRNMVGSRIFWNK